MKDGPCPFLGTPVTLYPLIGPWAGLHLTVTLLSFTSITSMSEGESTPRRGGWRDEEEKAMSGKIKRKYLNLFCFLQCVAVFTCLVCDIDRSAGCRAVSSPSYSVDGDSVVSTWLQVSDCCSGLWARHCELLRITVTSWIKIDNVINVEKPILLLITNLFCCWLYW